MKKKLVREDYVKRESGRKRISVTELQIGMFVSELDRPWLETPFLVQGFLIETKDHIECVQEFCDYVYIDAVQERYVPPEERIVQKAPNTQRYTHKVSVEQEHAQATGAYKHARNLTRSVLDDVRLGNALDAEKAKETVGECVDSILRNPDALTWLSRIRNVDEHIADHSLKVSILAIVFGRYLGMEKDELEKLGLCGLLHDIGKMKVSPALLSKSTPLTEDEQRIVQAHTIHGRNILMSNPSLYNGVTDVAHCHYEHLDGSGYPRGIKEVGLSPNTRIISIVDCYDRITSNIPGSPARSTLDALRHLYSMRGSRYDAQLVDQYIKCVGLYPPGSLVELASGEVGIVISTNYKNRRLPRVMMLLDAKKKNVAPRVLNLADDKQRGANDERMIKQVLVDGSHGVHLKEHLEKGLTFS